MPVQIHINQTEGFFPQGANLFESADELGVKVPTSCRKLGKCKECLVEVTEGMDLLTERSPAETHLKEGFRLSCCAKLAAAEGIVRCHTMRRGDMKIEHGSVELLGNRSRLKLAPAITKDGDRVLMDGQEIDIRAGSIYGIAMDLGTTTVVLRLINLDTGEIEAATSFENPQRFGGSDVMSRIQYDTEQKGKVLQRTLLGYLSHAIEDLPVDPHAIYEMVVAANSTMRDLMFGLSVYSIGQNPYQSLTEIEFAEKKRGSTSLVKTAKQMGLPLNPKARIYGMPIISGHVGADAAACMLAIDLAHEERTVALMDIGTNTELIVGNHGKIIAASCPAGPAFEGGAIRCGMPGLPGAIEKVFYDEDEEEYELKVIGDAAPVGICGSGLINLLSELLSHEKMNTLGRFEEDDEIVLAETDGEEIIFTESDVNELAQAKGANVAGLRIAFKEMGIGFDDVDVFYLAGGFGRHLDIESSKRIGLIPNLPNEKIVQVGNAAVEGACIALMSVEKREELERMIRKVRHCRLEADEGFFDYFVEGCQFKPVEDVGDGVLSTS